MKKILGMLIVSSLAIVSYTYTRDLLQSCYSRGKLRLTFPEKKQMARLCGPWKNAEPLYRGSSHPRRNVKLKHAPSPGTLSTPTVPP